MPASESLNSAAEDRRRALEILERGSGGGAQGPCPPAHELHALAQRLERNTDYGHARRLYELARSLPPSADRKLRRTLRHEHAICTYRDPDRGHESRLDAALGILDSDPHDETLAGSTDPETLGIAGAIHKRKWEIDGRSMHLERALVYYTRGYGSDPGRADGYPAINAAFLLDLLGSIERREAARVGSRAELAVQREKAARQLRQRLLETLAPRVESSLARPGAGDGPLLLTLAEAYAGVEDWSAAKRLLEAAMRLGLEPSALQSTTRQFAAVIHLRLQGDVEKFRASPARGLLEILVPGGNSEEALVGVFAGKVGLALSGGGFRASLFHLGVLARLAELDALRQVEVISCVSGGSIAGAQYYLELKRAIESKPGSELTREDYIEVVQSVQQAFVEVLRHNLRSRALFHPRSLVRWARGQNRTRRIAALLEQLLFSRSGVSPGTRMRDLPIVPAGTAQFHPRRDNWCRGTKIPILVLNATSLNTGHNWQFTASFMGEPPGQIEQQVDMNERLRRMYYGEAAPPHGDVELGVAVAASACVPGLFRPIALDGLYPARRIRLVDGGLRDNQGVYGLLEQDCNILLVSDASGQMGNVHSAPWLPWNVLRRSQRVVLATIRSEAYRHLEALQRGGRVREKLYLHLRKELDAGEVGWKRATHGMGADAVRDSGAERDPQPTGYGIPRRVQWLLSCLRTDLDAFSKDEAYTLMLSGYRMTRTWLSQSVHSLSHASKSTEPASWRFLDVAERLDSKALEQTLRVGQHRTFRRIRRWFL